MRHYRSPMWDFFILLATLTSTSKSKFNYCSVVFCCVFTGKFAGTCAMITQEMICLDNNQQILAHYPVIRRSTPNKVPLLINFSGRQRPQIFPSR